MFLPTVIPLVAATLMLFLVAYLRTHRLSVLLRLQISLAIITHNENYFLVFVLF